MSLIAALEALVESGATPEMMLAVARRMEAAREAELAQRRAKDAARKRKPPMDSTEFRGIPRNDEESAKPLPHVGEGAQVVTPSLPSLRSEEVKNPPEKPSVSTPKGAETSRGTRLPEDWRPIADYVASDFGLSHEQHADELAKFLDYWRSVPGAKGRKSDWPATWRNWMRRASEHSARKAPHERPHPDAKFDARQANLARALAGADSAAGRTWKP